jgi:hypothetical protein
MAKFRFGPEGVAIEEDLDKLVKLVRDLIKAGLTKKSSKSLKRLLREIQKIYNTIVKTVLPFYSINNDVKFKRSFSPSYEKFKEIYLREDVSNLEYSCNKVKKELDDLTIKGMWHDKFLDIFRSEKRKLEKEAKLDYFKSLIETWFTSDKRVYGAMKQLQDELNQGLDDVNTLINSSEPVSTSRMQLQRFLKDAEPRFNKIKRKQNELKELSDKL